MPSRIIKRLLEIENEIGYEGYGICYNGYDLYIDEEEDVAYYYNDDSYNELSPDDIAECRVDEGDNVKYTGFTFEKRTVLDFSKYNLNKLLNKEN